MGVCGYCGQFNTSMRLCGACLEVRYCCIDHQEKHWNIHKPYCIQKDNSANEKQMQSHLDLSHATFSLNNSINNSQYYNKFQEQTLSPSVQIGELEPSVFLSMNNIMTNSMKDSDRNPKPVGSLCKLNFIQMPDDFPQEWLTNVTNYLLRDLNHFGFSVIDNFLGAALADNVLSEVFNLQINGLLFDGQTVSAMDNSQWTVRGDKIAWITGLEQGCESISKFVSTVNAVVAYANKHENAGMLKNYHISYRTRAMVACYPGSGSRYVKHVDNPDGDGRCITAIYYVNKKWKRENGGVLRIYPKGNERVAQIEPIYDRMLFFWSDRRNPHEVLPSSCMRYAITVWYVDQLERETYEQRCLQVRSSSANAQYLSQAGK